MYVISIVHAALVVVARVAVSSDFLSSFFTVLVRYTTHVAWPAVDGL